jgi:DNA gyrase/topoisomerase IV subunit A
MSIQENGINYPMTTAVFDDAAAREWVVDEIERARRSCESRPDARRAVAHSIGIAPGTVENIDRDRLKGLRAWVRDKIHAHKIRCLEAEAARMVHELARARSGFSRASEDEIRAVETALEEGRAILKRARTREVRG